MAEACERREAGRREVGKKQQEQRRQQECLQDSDRGRGDAFHCSRYGEPHMLKPGSEGSKAMPLFPATVTITFLLSHSFLPSPSLPPPAPPLLLPPLLPPEKAHDEGRRRR